MGFAPWVLVLLGTLIGDAAAAMADHVLYGWLFFTIVTLLLIAIGIGFREDVRPVRAAERSGDAPPARGRIAAVMATGLLLALVGPAYLTGARARLGGADCPAGSRCRAGTERGWVREPATPGDWMPAVTGADRVST